MSETQRSRPFAPARGRRIYQALVGRPGGLHRQDPDYVRRIVEEYEVGTLILDNGRVPVQWWANADNFGDQLSPWLIAKMTGREVVQADPEKLHYLAVGSILKLANANSEVWGSGSFGTEKVGKFSSEATYSAVRGPLSRARLRALDIQCADVFGDPALLAPAYFAPKVDQTHKYGIVARWSERRWHQAELGPGVKLIDLRTTDVEGVIEEILSCRFIVTGSLHGLIMADAYGIPSAWVMSRSAHGGEYKYFDYFSTVNKFRNPRTFDASRPVTAARLRDSLEFDDRPIEFDHRALLDACPFLDPVGTRAEEPSADGLPAYVQV
ncbi:MAG: hypothetical protein JWO11_3478 [Nocardioides sp.]|nr:hypothetical protein [Nocardioides sp.]